MSYIWQYGKKDENSVQKNEHECHAMRATEQNAYLAYW